MGVRHGGDRHVLTRRDLRVPLRGALCAFAIACFAACDGDGTSESAPRGSGDAGTTTAAVSFLRCGENIGIAFTHESGARGEYRLTEIMGSGCALFDYDGDGDLDVYAVQGSPPAEGAESANPGANLGDRLFRNELAASGGGALRFADVTVPARLGARGYGMGCAVGDIDSDGHLDLYVSRFGDDILYRNRGDGTFDDVTERASIRAPGFTTSAAFLDYDRDGDLDLFVCTYVEYSFATNRDCYRLGGERDYCGPASYSPLPDRLFRNSGDGTYTDVSIEAGIATRSAYGLGVVCADLDDDGWVDILVANDATPNHFWRNRHDGTFEEVGLVRGVAVNASGSAEAGMGIVAADFDEDGDLDLFLTHEVDETNTLYRNLGAGQFEDLTAAFGLAAPSLPYSGFGVAWQDFDGDGRLDLFVANGAVRKLASQLDEERPFRQPDMLMRNDGEEFVRVAFAPRPAAPDRIGRGVAAGDVDNDGDVDLLVASNDGPLELFLNDAVPAAWTTLRLEGTRSARDAYDARVTVRLESGKALHRRVAADGSYLSASDPRVHVALPEGETVAALEVRWPSGVRERFAAPPANRETRLREGTGEAAE